MPQAKDVNNIVVHCSAGYSGVRDIEDFWRNTLGWKSKGYHVIIDLSGQAWYLIAPSQRYGYSTDQSKCRYDAITNGVFGYNSESIHICYIGGVDPINVKRALDSRTPIQKQSLSNEIGNAVIWLKNNGKDVIKNLGVVGHRDFSNDKNSNGVIESWERIKECPSFDVIGTTDHYLYSSKDRYNKLPTL